MPFSQITAGWAVLILTGVLLVSYNSRAGFASAVSLRGKLWKAVILFGEEVSVPLYFVSAGIGLVAALPIFGSVAQALDPEAERELSNAHGWLLALSLLARVYLWPALALDWTTVGQWEQEVVRRPRGRLLAYLRSANHSVRTMHSGRASEVGHRLARNELLSSPALRTIPKQSLGLLLIYIALMSPLTGSVPTQLLDFLKWVFVLACSAFVLRRLLRLAKLPAKPTQLFLLIVCFLSVTAFFVFPPTQAAAALLRNGITLENLCPYVLSAAILSFLINDLNYLLKSQSFSEIEVGSAPLDKRYSFLKKFTLTARWLAKPQHLVCIFMHSDVVLTTLTITLS